MEKRNKIIFDYEYFPELELVRDYIRSCEGIHVQQIAYSSFHDCLTQICFGCAKIRTNMKVK